MNIGTLQSRLTAYLDAEKAVLKNQSYTIGTRTYTRANLKWIQDYIDSLRKQIAKARGKGTIRVRKAVFRDE